MNRFVSFWIQFVFEHGEIGKNTDNYLHEVIEWWSGDGAYWERQKTKYRFYTGGTYEPIAHYNTIQQIINDIQGYENVENIRNMTTWLNELKNKKGFRITYEGQLQELHWAVDTGNVQRDFDVDEVRLPKSKEFQNLYKRAEHY